MVNVLGINPAPDHDTSACILVDGKLVAAAEEERFNRQKHTREMPFRSIRFCMSFAGLKWSDIDYIAIPWSPSNLWRRYFTLMLRNPAIETAVNLVGNLPYPMKYRNSLYLKREFASLPEIRYIPHHYAHACTAFFPSGLDSSSILTVDAVGENDSTVSWKGDNRRILRLRDERYGNSLGEIYTAITEYLGFKPYSDEGKTMGLAPYGAYQKNVHEQMKDVIDPERGRWYKVDPSIYLLPGDRKNLGKLSLTFKHLQREHQSPLDEIYPDVAWTLQEALEQALVRAARDTISSTGSKNLCLSGGVALNCKANGVVRQRCEVSNFFAFPAANDAGASIGAAMAVAMSLGEHVSFKMEHASFGPEFSNDHILSLLDERSLKYEYHKDIAGVCAELLSDGNVIGWFQGRMEIGPRALGNRSILADPRDDEMKDRVNLRVKKREHWRPFCPSMLFEAKDEYLVDACEAPFMILSFQVPPAKVKEISAVVHVDGSTRPQIVKREVNPLYWNLIKRFEAETGTPVILNTSFNLAGEPIVCTPNDAIRAFFDSGLDFLALGDFLLAKR